MVDPGQQGYNVIHEADRAANPSTEAEIHLAKLDGQISTLRAVLVQLLQDVVLAEARLDHGEAAHLLQSNEQLVISALGAQMAADTAHDALDEASRLSGLDPLTGLQNRTVLLDRFELAISHAKRNGNRVAILFLDLNAFKQINDRFGHASGDRALQLVADCLSALVRETDTVSRHGGDEFLVLLAEIASAEDAELVAMKVHAALDSTSQFDNQQLHLGASIGIGIYPEDGGDAKTLIAFADAAMYVAKQNGVRRARLPPATAPSAARHVTGRSVLIHPKVNGLEQEVGQRDLREANERLILAALGAQELLAAAEATSSRQSELLLLVAEELSSPFAPIRLAASVLGIPGAEAELLPRVQIVIDEQADRLAKMVRSVLLQPSAVDVHRPQ